MAGGNTLLRRLSRQDRSEVNNVVKYLLFGFNSFIWLIGVGLICVGAWAAVQKNNINNITMLTNSIVDPVTLLIVSGVIIFIIGFFGCIGALRENIPLLIAYVVLLVIVLLLLVALAIIAFAFKSWLKKLIVETSLKDVIPKYRDDPDLKNLIDWVQEDWLHCCGLQDYNDWELNIYFNCSSPGMDACGVPYSCCIPDPNAAMINLQCGQNKRRPNEPNSDIYKQGCIDAGDAWFNTYIIPIAGVVVGVAVLMILGICCSWNLVADVKAQKAKWDKVPFERF
ncbi:hypothetical protein HELRODRAFT_184939 [Helobdella robusta]|uniref:Tetraspanin n=1 Tax=Helobdella robusta TaxID=6412 RepID=T1FM68_HELRO|nr:hypothetical protein HELRODRAFT_184939 [Helobdella robusta]ESO06548.1 hypothetical protein HELRODRAFT_184939 [Helobdella robusta]